MRKVAKNQAGRGKLSRRSANTRKTGAGTTHTVSKLYLTGKISIAAANFGFVAVNETLPETLIAQYPVWAAAEAHDIFIPPVSLLGAMNGDEVKIALLPADPDFASPEKGPAGEVVQILHRARESFVGEVIARDRVRPLDRKLNDDIVISGGLQGSKIGDWVEVRLDFDGGGKLRRKPRRLTAGEGMHERRLSSAASGEIIRCIGLAGVIQFDLDAVVAEYGLLPRYTPEEDDMAAALPLREIAREDLTQQFIVTIDPFDAKDYDDAISVRPGKKPGTLEVGAHIADVASFIAPGSYFDREAEKRSFTAYLPGRTLPMLPPQLTARVSMRPEVAAPAHSVLLEVDAETGKVLGFRRTHSTLLVRYRLNYTEVQEFLDHGTRPDAWSDELCENLRNLADITRKMRRYRKQNEQFLDLEIPEIRILCDEKENKILGLERKEQKSAEQMVEECMLAANSAVAAELTQRKIPGLYRVHPEPEVEKLEEFSALSEGSFQIPTGDLSTRTGCRYYLEHLPDDTRKQPLLNAFLRSMARAFYQSEPAIHFGLGKGLYSHFTSPLRRYPDLLVHQQLFAADTNGSLRSLKTMEELAASTSEKEANNDEAYFTASDRMKLRYLDEMLSAGHENYHAALVVRVLKHGVVVEIPEFGIQGLVPADDLPGAWRGREQALAKCQVGSAMFVTLDSIDFTKNSAIFRAVSPKKSEE